MNEKIESHLLEPRLCEPRCCWHFGVGRRVCCRCGNTRVEKVQARDAIGIENQVYQ